MATSASIIALPEKRDFSQFIRQKHTKYKVPNIVNIFVGSVKIECNGVLLAQHSTVLQRMIINHKEILLDNFTDAVDGAWDCLKLLYGGKINVHMGNIKPLLKFSVLYEVRAMYRLCVDWVQKQLSITTFCSFFTLGLFVHNLDDKHYLNYKIIHMCKEFLSKDPSAVVAEIDKTWATQDNTDIMLSLIDKHALPYIIPVLTRWMDSNQKISVILTGFKKPNFIRILAQHKHISLDLINKMNVIVEKVETAKNVNTLLTSVLEKSAELKDIEMLSLLLNAKQWRQCSKDQLKSLFTLYKMEYFIHIEIFLDWIMTVKPPQEVVDELWSSIIQTRLHYQYIKVIRNTISILKYNIPDVIKLEDNQYRLFRYEWVNTSITPEGITNLVNYKPCLLLLGDCEVAHCTESTESFTMLQLCRTSPYYNIPDHAVQYHNYSTTKNDDVIIDSCRKQYTINGSDRIIFTSDLVMHCHVNRAVHWYMVITERGNDVIYSMVTNTLQEILTKINSGKGFAIVCLFDCN